MQNLANLSPITTILQEYVLDMEVVDRWVTLKILRASSCTRMYHSGIVTHEQDTILDELPTAVKSPQYNMLPRLKNGVIVSVGTVSVGQMPYFSRETCPVLKGGGHSFTFTYYVPGLKHSVVLEGIHVRASSRKPPQSTLLREKRQPALRAYRVICLLV